MASDNFNRPDEDPVDPPWLEVPGGIGNYAIADNTLISATSGDKLVYYDGAVSTPGQYCQAVVGTGALDGGPAVRVGGEGGLDAYMVITTSEVLAKIVGGAFESIGALGLPEISALDTVRIEAEGDQISVYTNGVEHANSPFTDASIGGTGDGVGFFIFDSSADPAIHYVDDFDGGDLVTAAPPHFRPAMRSRGTSW